jgi:hypothetical protein
MGLASTTSSWNTRKIAAFALCVAATLPSCARETVSAGAFESTAVINKYSVSISTTFPGWKSVVLVPAASGTVLLPASSPPGKLTPILIVLSGVTEKFVERSVAATAVKAASNPMIKLHPVRVRPVCVNPVKPILMMIQTSTLQSGEWLESRAICPLLELLPGLEKCIGISPDFS